MKSNPVYHVFVVFIGLLAVTRAAVGQESLAFRRAVELALAQSSEMALSRADEVSAFQTYREARASKVPKLAIGSDIGYAYGFPLSLEGSAPTLFNVTTQSSVWNPAQREFIRAAKADWSASKFQGNSQRVQVILEVALTYIELNTWESRVPILRAELSVAENIEYTVAERVKEGIDKRIERTKAELIDAQALWCFLTFPAYPNIRLGGQTGWRKSSDILLWWPMFMARERRRRCRKPWEWSPHGF